MTMDVDHRMEEAGQSMLEFMFMLPVILGITVVMTRVNSAIQVSIVNQQYARAQATWLTFNSAEYPELRLRTRDFVLQGYNRLVLGVSGDTPPADESKYNPSASTYKISRSGKGGSDEKQTESITTRSEIRVRTIVNLCTQPNVIGGVPGTPIMGQESVLPFKPLAGEPGAYKLRDDSRFNYCGGPIDL